MIIAAAVAQAASFERQKLPLSLVTVTTLLCCDTLGIGNHGVAVIGILTITERPDAFVFGAV